MKIKYDFIYYPEIRILENVKTKEMFDILLDEHIILKFFINQPIIEIKDLMNILGVSNGAIKTKKCRLCKRTGLEIQSKRNYGYKLISRIKEEIDD